MSAKNTTSVRLSDEDKDLFAQAMAIECIDTQATWIIRAARLHAKQVIEGTPDALDGIKAQLLSMESKIMEKLYDIEGQDAEVQ